MSGLTTEFDPVREVDRTMAKRTEIWGATDISLKFYTVYTKLIGRLKFSNRLVVEVKD